MGTEILFYAGILILGIAVSLLTSVLLSAQADVSALEWATGKDPIKSSSGLIQISRPFVHRFCIGFALKIKNEGYRRNLDRKLKAAGMSKELNIDEFLGLQILWGVLFPLLILFLNFTLEIGLPIPLVALSIPFGALLPHLVINERIKNRRTQIISDLPFFIDLFALSTEAGLEFVSAIRRIIERSEGTALSEELMTTIEDITVGGDRAQAFKSLAARLDIPEVTSFVVVLNDAEAQGQSVSKVLKQQSVQMRLERFTRAEKAGARASQMMLFPLIFCIIPAVLIMVFGPVILQFLGGGS